MAHSEVRYRKAESRDTSGALIQPAGEWVMHPEQVKRNCCVIRDLQPNIRYEFQIRAVNADEWSEYPFDTMPSSLDWYHLSLLHRYKSELNVIVGALEDRLLPSFDDISEEADKAAEHAWNEYISRPATTEYDDPADSAEQAEDVGINLCMLLSGVRRGAINLFAVALYHAFEQQIIHFHGQRDWGLHICYFDKKRRNPVQGFRQEQLCKRIDIESFKSWQKIDELRLVANTVKHAEGDSAKDLRDIRRDFFEFPDQPIAQPLLGEDVEVSVEDIKNYRDHLVQFWEEFSSSPSGESVMLVL